MVVRSRFPVIGILPLLLLLVVTACRIGTEPQKPEGQITTTIAGRITDESGLPITGATVSAGGVSAQTDANGLYHLVNARVLGSRAVVIARKSGYFDGSRAAMPAASGATYIEFGLLQRTLGGMVSSANGGTISLTHSASITFPQNAFVTSSGTPYTGTVSVFAKDLYPEDANFSHFFPGDLHAYRTDSSLTELWSFGVIAAELEGASGEHLQLAAGKLATLTASIAPSQQSVAPASLPMWYFDQTNGIWNEEGTAIKQGNTYTTTVKHFSFWNYDMGLPYGIIHGRIVCGGTPIPGVHINLAAYVEGGLPNVITDGDGEFSVRVVAHRPDVVRLQVLSGENNGAYWTNAALPIDAAPDLTTELGDLSLNSPCPASLNGKMVGCDEKTLTAGMVVGSWAGGMSYVSTNNGLFKMVVPSNSNVTLTATSTTGELMQPRSFMTAAQGQNTDIGTIVACNTAPSDVIADVTSNFDGRILVYSPDGNKLAASLPNDDVVLLDTKTWKESSRCVGALTGTYGRSILRFSPDGSRLIISNANRAAGCWNVQGVKLCSISAVSAAFTSDGLAIVAGDYQGAAEYDLQGALIKHLSLTGYYPIVIGSLANGTMLISSYNQNTGKSNAYLWDVTNDVSAGNYALTTSGTDSMTGAGYLLSYDRKSLGLTGPANLLFIDAMNGAQQGTLAVPYDGLYGIAPDNAKIIGQYRAGSNNVVALVSIADGKQLHVFDPPPIGGYSNGVAISPDGTQAVAIYTGELRVWKVQ